MIIRNFDSRDIRISWKLLKILNFYSLLLLLIIGVSVYSGLSKNKEFIAASSHLNLSKIKETNAPLNGILMPTSLTTNNLHESVEEDPFLILKEMDEGD